MRSATVLVAVPDHSGAKAWRNKGTGSVPFCFLYRAVADQLLT